MHIYMYTQLQFIIRQQAERYFGYICRHNVIHAVVKRYIIQVTLPKLFVLETENMYKLLSLLTLTPAFIFPGMSIYIIRSASSICTGNCPVNVHIYIIPN